MNRSKVYRLDVIETILGDNEGNISSWLMGRPLCQCTLNEVKSGWYNRWQYEFDQEVWIWIGVVSCSFGALLRRNHAQPKPKNKVKRAFWCSTAVFYLVQLLCIVDLWKCQALSQLFSYFGGYPETPTRKEIIWCCDRSHKQCGAVAVNSIKCFFFWTNKWFGLLRWLRLKLWGVTIRYSLLCKINIICWFNCQHNIWRDDHTEEPWIPPIDVPIEDENWT